MARSIIHADRAGLQPGSWRDYVPAAWLVAAGAVVMTVLTLLSGGIPGHYLVVVPPWADAGMAAQVAFASGGVVIATGALSNTIGAAATVDDDPGFAARLRAHGAWLVLQAPPAGCYADGRIAP